MDLKNIILDRFFYNPKTGVLWRKLDDKYLIAGSKSKAGYIYITISIEGTKQKLLAHRIVWMICFGSFPLEDIDHINQDKSDNRLANLRLANRSQNMFNINPRPGQKIKGVSFDNRINKWRARIKINYKEVFLGHFDTPDAAAEAYNQAAIKYRKNFAVLNDIW